MISQILIGLLAIYYGAVQLDSSFKIKYFWWGLILFGIVRLVELLSGPATARFRRSAE